MNRFTQAILLTASTLRMVPHIALYLLHRRTIDADLCRYGEGRGGVGTFIKVCTRQQVFRNLFYYRMGDYRSALIKWMLPPEHTLHIWCPSIGGGCHFEHNYATYLNAESIGENLYCLHLVTLGNDSHGRRPTIGNNVRLMTGATVFGPVTIGDDVTIGAGCVVNRDVPPRCTVVGNPAVIVRRDGERVNIPL